MPRHCGAWCQQGKNPEMKEWHTAPRDGSEINVQFPDGTTAKARWLAGHWEVLREDGQWRDMTYVYGPREPEFWWT